MKFFFESKHPAWPYWMDGFFYWLNIRLCLHLFPHPLFVRQFKFLSLDLDFIVDVKDII